MTDLEIGVVSYRSPDKLRACLDAIAATTRRPYRLRVWHNPSEDAESDAALRVLDEFGAAGVVAEVTRSSTNVGYAGGVNGLIARCEAPYFAYFDNDTAIRTPDWDSKMIEVLDGYSTVAQVFPGSGHFSFHNGVYHECLWSAGFCWALNMSALHHLRAADERYRRIDASAGWPLDRALGHHEEVDFMIRLRMAGYLIACAPDVEVQHHETATRSPESEKRIHRGVVTWMEKINRMFCGDVFAYPNPDPDSGEGYDPWMLRYTDILPCALYLERWTLAQFPDWNANPRVVQTSQGPMHAVEVLKPLGPYVGRAL